MCRWLSTYVCTGKHSFNPDHPPTRSVQFTPEGISITEPLAPLSWDVTTADIAFLLLEVRKRRGWADVQTN